MGVSGYGRCLALACLDGCGLMHRQANARNEINDRASKLDGILSLSHIVSTMPKVSFRVNL